MVIANYCGMHLYTHLQYYSYFDILCSRSSNLEILNSDFKILTKTKTAFFSYWLMLVWSSWTIIALLRCVKSVWRLTNWLVGRISRRPLFPAGCRHQWGQLTSTGHRATTASVWSVRTACGVCERERERVDSMDASVWVYGVICRIYYTYMTGGAANEFFWPCHTFNITT